jgi:Domain of unknown function (DUF4263)
MRSYTIKNRYYGKQYLGRKVFYQGFRRKPDFLKAKGQGFSGGKHLLETLEGKLKRIKLILTPAKDRIIKAGSRHDVYISQKTLERFKAIIRERERETKLDAMSIVLASVFGGVFGRTDRIESYRRGMLSRVLTDGLDPRVLSMEDVRAVTKFAARIADSPKTVGFDERDAVRRKRSVQLIYLKKLIAEFELRLTRQIGENDWQAYFSEKILYFQDSYIRKVEKPNIAIVTTQFPDFGVVTADDYLDLIEIKTPSTPLLNEDASHNSFYWSADIAKAIAQTESYIESVTARKADIIVQIDKFAGLKLKIVKPRGLIIAGSTAQFAGNLDKMDYFRMLNEGLKNVEVIPFDDLSRRLRNTVTSIEKLEAASRSPKAGVKAKPKKNR